MRYLTIIFLFITTFATGQQQMFLRSTPAAGVTGILDSYTGAAAAYATALLYSSYGGSCLRVRRDSDNAEQDIGFSGQDIDEAAINSFCSGTNCFVKTWYDQSGSGNDATQTTAANQPKIYDSITGIIDNNSIAATLYQTSTLFTVLGFSDTTNTGFFIAHSPTVVTGNNRVISCDEKRNATIFNGQHNIYNGTTGASGGTASVGVDYLYSCIFNASTAILYVNSVSTVTISPNSLAASTNVSIGNALTTSVPYDGYIQVVVLFASDQSANRTGIETAINNYYNIYP